MSQTSIIGTVQDSNNDQMLIGALIQVDSSDRGATTDAQGAYEITIPDSETQGPIVLICSYLGYTDGRDTIFLSDTDMRVNFRLAPSFQYLTEVNITDSIRQQFATSQLRAVEGAAIYSSRKTEQIRLAALTANLGQNVSRQIYARISGLNIWESDGAGVQLGIGGRGLSPNRSSNFNVRQNGYDISADALGYPESYYTPPAEAIERIEIVRGAASLQYGTQFGGMVNFKFKSAEGNDPLQIKWRNTVGSFGFLGSFASLSGRTDRSEYYAFYQYKRSDGWRPNSSLDQHNAFASFAFSPTEKWRIRTEYTHMNYLAQQPGGLTDSEFEIDPRQSKRARNWFRVNWNLAAIIADYQITDRSKVNTRFFGLIGGRDALGNLDPINQIDFGENRDLLVDDFSNWGNETRFIHRYTTFDQPSTLLLGFRVYQGLTQRQQGDGNDGSDPLFEYISTDLLEGSDFDLPSKNYSFFAENLISLSDRWSITPGMRIEYINTESDGYYREIRRDLAGNIILDNVIDEQKSSTRSFAFFGLGASYRPDQDREIYFNASQNYRAINFNDLRVNVGNLVIDTSLQDERGYNIELGLRGRLGRALQYDMNGFFLGYFDRIGNVLRTVPNPVFGGLVDKVIRFRSNVADARIFGFEALLQLSVDDLLQFDDDDWRVNVFTNLAMINARYLRSDDGILDGKEVELVPPINFKTGLDISYNGLNVSWQYAFIDQHFTDATNAIRTSTAIEGIIPAYQVMDVSASYTYSRYRLESGINNLGNEFYFTRRATGYPGPGIIPSDGRSYYCTLEINF